MALTVQFVNLPSSYNRYSYVLNNPLNAIDPSGYSLKSMGRKFAARYQKDKQLRMFITGVSIIATIATGGAAAGGHIALEQAILLAMANGAAASFVLSYGSGAGFRQSLSAGMKGGIVAGLGASMSAGIGSIGSLSYTPRLLAHGVSQGFIAAASGGQFRQGFYAGAVGSATPTLPNKQLDLAVAMAFGGTASELSGGKFANGAVTAAFVRLYNHQHNGRSGRIDLTEHEGIGGSHTISEHVGKSDSFLQHRMKGIKSGPFLTTYKRGHSTFTSLESANKLVSSTISENVQTIDSFLQSDNKFTTFSKVFSSPTGRVAYRAGSGGFFRPGPVQLTDGFGVFVRINRNESMPGGYVIHTTYPIR